MPIPEWMDGSEHAGLLQGLLLISHADREITAEERLLLGALVDELGFIVSEEELSEWLDNPPTAEEVMALERDPLERRFLIRQALLLAMQDGRGAQRERTIVRRWAEAWKISEEELQSLERELEQDMQGAE